MSKKIVFMGTPIFSIKILEKLALSDFEVLHVYTQSPKKSLRGHKINSSPIQKCAEKLNIPVRNPININSKSELEFFKSLNPDMVLVVAYGKLIPEEFLKIPKHGFINIHASLLPKWRGAAPIQRSIMNSDTETGISIMRIVKELDAGPVMRKIKIELNDAISSTYLSKKLSDLASESIIQNLDLIIANKANFIEQDHSASTYAKKINKKESRIEWNETSKKILAKINGLNPDPGAWFEYKNSRYKIWKAKITNEKGHPGKVLDQSFKIACTDGSIEIIEIQKQGKKRLLIRDFLAGSKIEKGTQLE